MRRWILRVVLALLFLAALCIGGGFFYIRKAFSAEKIKAEIETQTAARTGYHMAIGALDFTWSGDIKLHKICLRNPVSADERCFLGADEIRLDLRIWPLLHKRIEVASALVQGFEINLFEEKGISKPGAKERRFSWSSPRPTTAIPASAQAQQHSDAELQLENIKIRGGVLNHESALLPIALGKSTFDLTFTDRREKQLHLEAAMAQGGKMKLVAAMQTANFFRSLKQVLSSGKIPPGDKASGDLHCEGCVITPLQRYVSQVSGKFQFRAEKDTLTLSDEDALLVLATFGATFKHTGKVALTLPDFGIASGEGSLVAPGITLHYAQLGRDKSNALHAAWQASVNLAAAHSMLKTAAALTGLVQATGQLNGGILSGTFQTTNLGLQISPNFLLESPQFSGRFVESTVIFAKQNFTVNKKWAIGAASGTLTKTAGLLALKQATFSFARGVVAASYEKTQAGLHSFHINAKQLRGQDLSSMFGLKATVFGNLNLTAKGSFSGDSKAAVKKSLAADISLSIGRGKIKDSFFQKGLFTGPLHKLEAKFSDIEFKSANANMYIAHGNCTARKVFFDAEEWTVQLRSEATLEGEGKAALDFRFKNSFVENVANPLLLGIESRKDGEFYDLPFACRGNVFSGSCYKQNW